MSLSKICRLFGISRQAIYQQRQRLCAREKELDKVKQFVEEIRFEQPRIGTRNYLIIENYFMFEKIDIKSFDDIVISYEFPSQKYKLSMFFTTPVKYEANKGLINKIICLIFNHNNNPYEIKRSYYRKDIKPLLSLIKECLPEVHIPDLENSIFWRTQDEKNIFDKMQLIYSKSNLTLKNVLKKHKMIIEK